MKMKRPEQKLQIAIGIWFHVPNGGARTAAEGRIFKSMGVRAGVPDLIFLWDGRAACIELKAGRGRLSESQQRFRDDCDAHGIPWRLATSIDDVQHALADWGIKIMHVHKEWHDEKQKTER